ncbi:hypothetical protein CYMTET_48527 [Cymbomonas tetramitiformis]|uniref:Uncharacterized protein n=1 Tax=Cymbomonas tetramitiformis TaxID=36881 RepID=A0AAE0EUX0_9CHLO|nr:hypothetical protein CYMTET_48527 [Cymbomonas tetramitiformis]
MSFLERLWYDNVKGLLTFTAERQVIIADWRLGLLFRTLQLPVLCYVIFQLVYTQNFLVQSSVSAVFSMYTGDAGVREHQEDVRQALRKGDEGGAHSFCASGSEYDFYYDDDWSYNFSGCDANYEDEISFKGAEGSSYFFTTNVQETHYFRARNPQGDPDACSAILEAEGTNPCANQALSEFAQNYYSTVTQESNDVGYFLQIDDKNDTVCICKGNRGRFTVGAENVTLKIDHYYHSNTLSGQLVKTYLTNVKENKVLKKFEAGYTLEMTVQELLQWANVDLDARCDEGSNAQWLTDQSEEQKRSLQGSRGYQDGKYPYLRTSGLNIEVTMEYYNYRLVPAIEGLDDMDKNRPEKLNNARASTVCIMTLRPYLVWTSIGHDLTWHGKSIIQRMDLGVDKYRYGVSLSFKSGGIIAHFDYFNLITAFTQGMVLLGVASTIVNLFIRYGYENMYAHMILEKCDALSEYARFAVRALVASVAFDLVDDGDNGLLSKPEVFKKLRLLFFKRMSYSETATLVEFIMYMAEELEAKSSKAKDKYKLQQKAAKGFRAARKAMVRGFGAVYHTVGSCLSRCLPDMRLTKTKKASGEGTDILLTPCYEIKKRRIKTHKRTLGREEWVNVFTGAPCSVQKCLELVQRKHAKGQLEPDGDIFEHYAEVEKIVTEDISGEIVARLKNQVSINAFRQALESYSEETLRGSVLPSPVDDPGTRNAVFDPEEAASVPPSRKTSSAQGLPKALSVPSGEGRVPRANSVDELVDRTLGTLSKEKVLEFFKTSCDTRTSHKIDDTDHAEFSLLMTDDNDSAASPPQDEVVAPVDGGANSSGSDPAPGGSAPAAENSAAAAQHVVLSVQDSGTRMGISSSVLIEHMDSTVGTLDKSLVLQHMNTEYFEPLDDDVQGQSLRYSQENVF